MFTAFLFLLAVAQGPVELVSQNSSGVPSNGASYEATISADGRVVAFISGAGNLAPGDSPNNYDVFVRDRIAGTTELAAASWSGGNVSGDSREPSLSADGRLVAFVSSAINIVPDDTNGAGVDLFVRDRALGTTRLASLTHLGTQVTGGIQHGSISADGAWVVFESRAGGFVAGDTNGVSDVFVRNLQTGGVERVSRRADGSQAVLASRYGSLSADGTLVAFSSFDALVPEDHDGFEDVYVLEPSTGVLRLASPTYDGSTSNNESTVPVISQDGTTVAFASNSSRLVPGDTNGRADVFWRDLVTQTTGRASLAADGAQLGNVSWYPALCGNGRVVGFWSQATGVVPGVPALSPGAGRAYLFDRGTHATTLVDTAPGGAPGNRDCDTWLSLSGDARWVAWGGASSNLGAGDRPDVIDVFARDRFDGLALFDFENEDDLATPLRNGQHIDTEFGRLVRISAAGANLGATTFDTTPGGPNDPGLDADLLIDHGNVLVLQHSAYPAQTVPGFFDTVTDDDDGGDLFFDFLRPADPQSVLLADLDPPPNQGASVSLIDASGRTRVYSVEPGWTGGYGDPGPWALDLTTIAPQPGNGTPRFATASEEPGFEQANVVRMVVHLTGFGAMDDVSVRFPSLLGASATVRNGSGANPLLLRASSRPVLGTTWTATLDTSWSSGGLALLDMRGHASSGSFTPFGERLVDGALLHRGSCAYSTASTALSWPIPFDPSLCGVALHVQALCVEASPPAAAKVRAVRSVLTNALDLVLGF